jgi:hypothetical protein
MHGIVAWITGPYDAPISLGCICTRFMGIITPEVVSYEKVEAEKTALVFSKDPVAQW